MRVYLTGFMGAGKTTVGRLLAERLGWPFVDLDTEVERAAGMAVREVFAAHGEAAFRELELEALRRTLELDPAVIATGGGTPTSEPALRLLRAHGLVVWLNPSFATIAARIGALGKPDRPLFQDEAQALALYGRRLPAYRLADLTVEVSAQEQAPEVAARLALLLKDRACAT
jgi:shikimate kinase